jgi:hypothetical protein
LQLYFSALFLPGLLLRLPYEQQHYVFQKKLCKKSVETITAAYALILVQGIMAYHALDFGKVATYP